MIKGIGMDLVELSRMERAIQNDKFVKRILTEEEYHVFFSLKGKRQVEFAAGRFAAKEAFSKALGTGIGKGLSWQDMMILNDPNGKPELTYKAMSKNDRVHISISHTTSLASAYVIIESLSG